MPIVHLSDRALVRVSGPDAEHFLHNIITADISERQADVAKPSALLTPQGKMAGDDRSELRQQEPAHDHRGDAAHHAGDTQ